MGNFQFASDATKPKSGKEIRDRAMASIIAAFVADAATTPLQWVDKRIVDELLLKRNDGLSGPEFYPIKTKSTSTDQQTDSKKHIRTAHYTTGKHSNYAEETIPLMESMTRQGTLDIEDVKNEMLLSFYDCDKFESKNSMSMNHFISNRKKSPDNSYSECVHPTDTHFTAAMKVIVVVARYAGNPNLIEKIEDVVQINQGSEAVLTAARLFGRLLEKVILGSSIAEALAWASEAKDVVPQDEREYLNVLLPEYIEVLQRQQRVTNGTCWSASNSLTSISSISLDTEEDKIKEREKERFKEKREKLEKIMSPKHKLNKKVDPYANTDGEDEYSVSLETHENTYLNSNASSGSRSPSPQRRSKSSEIIINNSNITTIRISDPPTITLPLLSTSTASNHNSTNNNITNNNNSTITNPISTLLFDILPYITTTTTAFNYYTPSSPPHELPLATAAKIIGTDGTVPEVLLTSIYALKLSSIQSYESAIRANISASGDNVCRAWIIGSLLAAEQGLSSIPPDWKNRTPMYAQVEQYTRVIVGSNQFLELLSERRCQVSSMLK